MISRSVFISCRFQDCDREVKKWFEEKLKSFDLLTLDGNDAANCPAPKKVLSKIQSSDMLMAIVTKPLSPWVQNEIGMAYALGKPIIAFYEEGILEMGLYPFTSDRVTFSRNNLDGATDGTIRLINSSLKNIDLYKSILPPVDENGVRLLDQDNMTRILPYEIEKSRSMDIWAYTSETFLNAACHEALNSNNLMKIRVLIRDPCEDERKKPMALASLSFLNKLNLSDVEVRCYTDVPLIRAIIFDKSRGYVGFYRWDPQTYFQFIGAENNSLVQLSHKSIFEKLWLELYISRFEFEWNRSKKVDLEKLPLS
jgi:hypothetical protein